MKLSEKQREFTFMVAKLINWVEKSKHSFITFGEVYRPKEMQEIYLKEGKTKVKHSKHQDRLAVDFNLFINGKYTPKPEDYRPLGEYWETLGGRWGGRFGVPKKDWDKKNGWDSNHFEYKD